jgi:hypothetical protein
MSEQVVSHESLDVPAPERLRNALWDIEMAVHGNLAEHDNSESIVVAYTDANGAACEYRLGRTPADGTDAEHYPTLAVTVDTHTATYIQMDYDRAVCCLPDDGATDEHAGWIQEMANNMELCRNVIYGWPQFVRVEHGYAETPRAVALPDTVLPAEAMSVQGAEGQLHFQAEDGGTQATGDDFEHFELSYGGQALDLAHRIEDAIRAIRPGYTHNPEDVFFFDYAGEDGSSVRRHAELYCRA